MTARAYHLAQGASCASRKTHPSCDGATHVIFEPLELMAHIPVRHPSGDLQSCKSCILLICHRPAGLPVRCTQTGRTGAAAASQLNPLPQRRRERPHVLRGAQAVRERSRRACIRTQQPVPGPDHPGAPGSGRQARHAQTFGHPQLRPQLRRVALPCGYRALIDALQPLKRCGKPPKAGLVRSIARVAQGPVSALC